MDHDTHEPGTRPATGIDDPLTDLLRRGARDLLRQAVEAELQTFLDDHAEQRLPDGRQAVVRNGHQPERTIATGIGDVPVRLPKTRDRSGVGRRFHSGLLPPYLRRTRSIDELLPWLYLKGISTGDFAEALTALLGGGAAGLSAGTLSRLKQKWRVEYDAPGPPKAARSAWMLATATPKSCATNIPGAQSAPARLAPGQAICSPKWVWPPTPSQVP